MKWLGIAAAGVWILGGTGSMATPPRTGAFLEAHCTVCHDASERKGDLDLEALQPDFSDPATFQTWVKVFDRIASGEMPPKKKTRPPENQRAAVLSELDSVLYQADAARTAGAGRVRMRRMTRSEYENTLQDLLALPRLDIQGMLPSDGSVAGFDKIAGGLEISPAHLSAYTEAAEKALSMAIATRSSPPPVFRQRVYPAGLFKFKGNLQQGNFVLLKDRQPDPALPIRGGFEHVKGYIAAPNADSDMEARKQVYQENQVAQSQSAVGLLMPNQAGYEAGVNVAPIYSGMYRLRLSLWGFQWNQGEVEPSASPQAAVLRAHEEGKQQEGGRLLRIFTARSLSAGTQETTTWIDAHESIVFDPVSVPWPGLQIRQVGGRTAKHAGPGVALDWFEFEGPLHPTWPPESHRRLFGDLPIAPLPEGGDAVEPVRLPVRQVPMYLPALTQLEPKERKPVLETVQSSNPEEDARRLLGLFIPKAFRRAVSKESVEPYVALVKKRVAAKDCFEDAMRRAYIAVLTSPEFLFHQADSQGAPADNKESFTLASRLSYWLWNGAPDAALLAAAEDGSLKQPGVLLAQINRLLSDPRSDRFYKDFVDQWLMLNRIEETTPDPKLYPEYSFLLHQGMLSETYAFFRELVEQDLPIGSLLRPGFAMLNQRLAEHYGIPGVEGVEVRRVSLPENSLRGGLLGHAAILKLTANGTTTSPVKRGVWLMDRLLNEPAPPPPPGVSKIDPDTRGATTVREQLDRHRADASCAACHARIDPAGFALESFDPVGGFRDRYRSNGKGDEPPEKGRQPWRVSYKLGPTVDSSGVMPDGRAFSGTDGLAQVLCSEPARLARAFATQLTRYATGADLSYAERRVIEEIVQSTADRQYGLRSIIHALAASPLFTGK